MHNGTRVFLCLTGLPGPLSGYLWRVCSTPTTPVVTCVVEQRQWRTDTTSKGRYEGSVAGQRPSDHREWVVLRALERRSTPHRVINEGKMTPRHRTQMERYKYPSRTVTSREWSGSRCLSRRGSNDDKKEGTTFYRNSVRNV